MLSDAQKLDLLNDFFEWSGGDLPVSCQQVLAYMECTCPFQFQNKEEDEAIAYLFSEILCS